jgi:Domain of unknown function (DUF4429)/Short C-terminal domain
VTTTCGGGGSVPARLVIFAGMAQIFAPDGSWQFDSDAVRIVPGGGRSVHQIRRILGEVVVPLAAIAGVAFEPSGKGGHLRLRLRKGADPLADVVAGELDARTDPYRLTIPKGHTGAAEYLVDEIRDCLAVMPSPAPACESYLLPGPAVPISASAGDGAVSFDGERVRLDWTELATADKKSAGPQEFHLDAIVGVEWSPRGGWGYGNLRFRVSGEGPTKPPQEDPHCVSWGVQKFGGTTALVAAAVRARLPRQRAERPTVPMSASSEGRDPLVRRLIELAELHRSGVLTDEEFATAKQAILSRIADVRPDTAHQPKLSS